jgi:hypothetical protein
VRLDDAARHAKFWIHFGENSSTRTPYQARISMSVSLTDSETGAISLTRQETATQGVEVGAKQSVTTKASFGVEDLVKLGLETSQTTEVSVVRSASFTRQLTQAVSRSRTYTEVLTSTVDRTITIDPALQGKRRVMYLYPVMDLYHIPVVLFDRPNEFGQATRRREIDNVPVMLLKGWGLKEVVVSVRGTTAGGSRESTVRTHPAVATWWGAPPEEAHPLQEAPATRLAPSPTHLLHELGGWPPAVLFDALRFGTQPQLTRRLAQAFEVIGRPRAPLPSLEQGDIIVTRALAEPDDGTLSLYLGETTEYPASGGHRASVADVVRGTNRMLPIADRCGRLRRNIIILRPCLYQRGSRGVPPERFLMETPGGFGPPANPQSPDQLIRHLLEWASVNNDIRSGKAPIHIDQDKLKRLSPTGDALVDSLIWRAAQTVKCQVHNVAFRVDRDLEALTSELNNFEEIVDPAVIKVNKIVGVRKRLALNDEFRWHARSDEKVKRAVLNVVGRYLRSLGSTDVPIFAPPQEPAERRFDVRVIAVNKTANVFDFTVQTLHDHPYAGQRSWRLKQIGSAGLFWLETVELNSFPWLIDFIAEEATSGEGARLCWERFLRRFVDRVGGTVEGESKLRGVTHYSAVDGIRNFPDCQGVLSAYSELANEFARLARSGGVNPPPL